MSQRTFVRSPRMSDHEALMWTIEKDPWMNASGASLSILDRPLDPEKFRRTMRDAVVAMPRLYERVIPGLGRLSTPAWGPDPEFDIDHHVRWVELPAPGDERALYNLASTLYEEPLDRTRPLWRFVAISGLEGRRGALYSIVHHVIADGIGQMRMAELYQTLHRDDPAPDDVDLEAIVAQAVADAEPKEVGGAGSDALLDTVRHTAGHLARRQFGLLRRTAGEVSLWGADPRRGAKAISAATELATATIRQILPSSDDEASGSSLWTGRSRHRHLEVLSVDLDPFKAATKAAGVSINDGFLAALAEGASRYHRDRDALVQSFNSSFVISTRTDRHAGGNAFTPVPISLPGGPVSLAERMAVIHDRTSAARDGTSRAGGIDGLSGLLNQLPTSVLTRAARNAGAKIDFATSNLRGAPLTLYCAGARVEATIAMGPVAGTGANITAMSYDGMFNIGMFIDPHAIAEPQAFRDAVESAFRDMIGDFAKAQTKPTANKATAKRAKAKQAKAKQATARRATRAKAAKKSAAKRGTSANRTGAKKTATKPAAKQATSTKKTGAKKTATKPAAKQATSAKRTGAKKTATKPPAKQATSAKKTATTRAAGKRSGS